MLGQSQGQFIRVVRDYMWVWPWSRVGRRESQDATRAEHWPLRPNVVEEFTLLLTTDRLDRVDNGCGRLRER